MVQLQLREYQKEGRDFLYHRKRAFLTDWPGLGKSVQATEAAEKPVLIACGRKNLVYQWYDFLTAQYPDDVVSLATGTRKERDKALSKKADWYIINVHMLRSYALPTNIKTFIVDEAHHLRNRTADKSKAAAKFARKYKDMRVYLLTATPMYKELDDIWMQLHILYPQIFTSYHNFVEMFFVTEDTEYGKKVLSVKDEMRAELDEILQPIKLGRTYHDVGRYLPEIIETVVPIELDSERRKIYRELQKKYKILYKDGEVDRNLVFNPVSVLHAFRQITFTGGKIEEAREIIEDNKKQTLVGLWYKDHAAEMQKHIPNSVLVTGDIEPETRYKICNDAVRTGKHIVATIESITEGINLSTFRQIIMAEEHYPPGTNLQFIGRVVRDRNDDGENDEPVLVYYLHVKNTIDGVIHRHSRKRSSNIKGVIAEALV